MDGWKVAPDSQTGGFTHVISGGRGHPMLVPLVSSIFQLLRVSASLSDGRLWWSIHSEEPNLIPFEVGHTVELPRWAYNGKKFAEVEAKRKVVRGTYSGLSDFFVPVLLDGRVATIMVVGPFLISRPSGADVVDRWRWLTGRQGHPADPEFAAYLRTTLDTLVLEGSKVRAFERLLTLLARLMAGEGRADAIANQADVLRRALEPARFTERMWKAARDMIDVQSSHVQHSASRHYDLNRMGLSVAPDQVLVGLFMRRGEEIDPVEELVQREAFQRESVELATKMGDMIAGQIGNHGVVFLLASRASSRQKKRKVSDFAEQVLSLGRKRFGLSVHFGASVPSRSTELHQSYQAALGAAELALTQGKRLIVAETSSSQRVPPFWSLREELARAAHEHAGRLPAMFDRYIEAVSALSGHRLEPARAELQIAIERVTDALLQSGALDAKGALALRDTLDRLVGTANTLNDLFAAYRTTVADLSAAAERPAPARQDRGLRGALDYIHQHYSEPLSLERVARVSGFARTYFSELFKQHQGMTFQRYLFALRVEHAKKLLTGTELSVTRIAELSGHRSTAYMCRVFQRVVRTTPLEYRRGVAPHRVGHVHHKSERSTRSAPLR
jgi:AraC-like DNA-binding protein